MREMQFDEWLEEYERRRGKPPRNIKSIMEEPPRPGISGILPGEDDDDV